MIQKLIDSVETKIRAAWSDKKKHNRLVIIISLIYLIAVGIFLMIHQAPFSPDQFLVLAFVFVLFIGQAKNFLADWVPLVLLILVYEYLRGIIPTINPTIHYEFMIKFDTFIFGKLPTTYLQQLLFNPGYLHWYDYTSAILYSSFYVVPLILAFVFWITDRPIFKKYMGSILGLFYAGFITYLVYPAAPPWLASKQGLIIPPLTRILDLAHFMGSISLPTVYHFIGDNLTAAVPSLHAALSLLTALFVYKKYPKFALLGFAYALAVCLAVIYLGEHYFFDVVLGIIYALVVYFVTINWSAIRSRFKPVVSGKTAVEEAHSKN
ncbi:phosphatase PAP2 family protein [Patescibacteria group bacterium]|nr:phosphatase PAP2 family protein [Patescibacteria group bacterium]